MTLLFILFSLFFFTILAYILSSCFGFTNYLSSIISFLRFSMISKKKISHSFFVAPFVSHIQRARFASSILTTTNSSLSYIVCRMSPLSYVACLSNALSPPMHPTKKELFLIPYSLIPYIPSLIPHPDSLISTFYSSFFIPYFVFLFHILSIHPDHFYNHLGSVFNSILYLLFFLQQ